MKRFEVMGLCAVVAGLTGLTPALAQDDSRLSARAVELVEVATANIAQAGEISVSWFVSFDQVVDGREIVTHIRSGDALLARGRGYYAYAEQESGAREFFYDGAALTVNLVNRDAYVSAPFVGTFEQLAERVAAEYDTALPIWQVLVDNAADQFLGDVTDAAYLGQKRVAGQNVHHVALSGYDLDLQMWISVSEPAVPVMIVGTNPYEQGWPQFRAYFTNWDFAPEIEEGTFTYVPGEETSRLSWPKRETEAIPQAEGGE